MRQPKRFMRQPKRFVIFAAIVFAAIVPAAIVLTLSSCAGGSGTTSGIRGIVLFEGGPGIMSPSPLPGGFGSGRQGRPYRFVAVQVIARSGADAGRVVARVKPDSAALFRIAVPPGRYELKALVPKSGPWPRPTTVVVARGAYARALVYVEGR
jgi:hypothetical protein